ncbi:ATP synthase F1 subunit delta [Bacteroidetes bacterium SCGC AAA795-G10]|nr:ATP synthase F1 subunit delta [Bacteroidetes bacterium SCGC AAA795-G10]
MKSTRTAFRYAKATLDYANENKFSDKVAKEMQGLIELYESSKQLKGLLSNPFLPNKKKQLILRSIVPNSSDVTQKLLNLLTSNSRLFLLKEVAKSYIQLFSEQQGELNATVISAIPLTQNLEKQIHNKLEDYSGKKIYLLNKIDKSLLGGFILKIGDMEFNSSLAFKLKTFRAKLTSNSM